MSELMCELPFRKGDTATDWKVLQKYIKSNYKDLGINVTPTLERMNELRKVILSTAAKSANASEAVAENTLKPYILLVSQAQSHLPICSGEVKNLIFVWKDLWDESKRSSVNSNTELASCLMNLAAVYTVLGSQQGALSVVEGIKQAFQYYQAAAGLYSLVSSFTKRLSPNDIIGDFAPDSLSFLQQFCLAQAHHCSYMKAEKELTGKHQLLSKIAMEASKIYAALEGSARALGRASPFLCTYAGAAKAIFTARAHLHLASDLMAREEVGEALGRYNAAMEALSTAQASGKRPIEAWIATIQGAIAQPQAWAQNQNDTVYFAKVKKNLPSPDALGKPMGKPTPMGHLIRTGPPPKDAPGEPVQDPFKGIVPVHVQKAASQFRSSMQDHVLDCSRALQAHRERSRKSMSQLEVTSMIESAEAKGKSAGRVPDSLRKKISSLRTEQSSGKIIPLMDTLINMLAHIANTREVVITNLTRIEAVLDQEAQEDVNYRKQFGDTIWSSLRSPSASLPDSKALRKFVIETKGALQIGVTNPMEEAKVQVNEHLRDLSRLDWPMEDLDGIMPYMKSSAAVQYTNEMLVLIEQLRGIVARHDQIEEEEQKTMQGLQQLLQSGDIAQMLSSAPTEQHAEVLEAATNEFQARIQTIIDKTRAIDALLEEAQEVMVKLAQCRSTDPIAEEIQVVTNGLERACSQYDALHAKLADLSVVAAGLVDKTESSLAIAESFAAGRSLEAQDFKQTLEQQLAEKMREVAAKRAEEDSSTQSRSRQEELQRQIRELEKMQLQGAHRQQQQQQPPPQLQQQQPLMSMPGAWDAPPPYTEVQPFPQQQQQNLDHIFAPPPPTSQPYVYTAQPVNVQQHQHHQHPFPGQPQPHQQWWAQQHPPHGAHVQQPQWQPPHLQPHQQQPFNPQFRPP